jgi:aspartyl-tRNA(Asn)/glutamyl-tRNA(Gln) amidotransferase subunit B
VSDVNMEEGSLRCDANISLRPRGQEKFGTKAEVKNVNSFRFIKQALEYEIERQAEILSSGGTIAQETRLYNSGEGKTYSMRSKEQAHDYRYFPEPDLPPLMLSDVYIAAARDSLPELPEDRFTRYTTDGGLSQQDAGVLVAERDVADYFDAVVSAGAPSKKAANWVINEVLGRVDDVRRLSAADLPVPAKALAELIALVEAGTLSGKLGKEVFARMWSERRRAGDIVAAEGLAQVSDEGSIEEVCRKVVAANPSELGRYRGGEKKLLGFFVGAVMKETGGKANPKSANEILRRLLDEGQ